MPKLKKSPLIVTELDVDPSVVYAKELARIGEHR